MSVVFPIENSDRFASYTASAGQTMFPVPFPFQDNADVTIRKIALDGTVSILEEATHYTLIGAENPAAGSFTLFQGALEGEKYQPIGAAILDRLTSVVRNGRFASKATDDELDRNRIIQQEQNRDIRRAVKVDYGAPEQALPSPSPGKYIGWADGKLVNKGVSDLGATEIVTDPSLAGASDENVPSAKAVKAFASNPANSTFLQSGTGAVWRTVKAKLKDAYITPADFGAKFDCVSLTDASITGGSAALTSATASFSNDDIGKTIVVENGGTDGAVLITTIASVESSTSLTLATNALNTWAGRATYGTLDTAALQKTLDFCCSAGLTLQFPAARCFSEALTASGIVSWIGAGQGTSQVIFTGDNGITYTGGDNPRLHPSPAVYAKEIGFITAADANAATAVLDISFSGQWTAIRSVELESVRVQGLKDGSSFAKGISLFNCSNFVLDKPEVINANPVVSGTYGIYVDGDEQPVDMYIRTPQVRFCDEGIHINSRVDGQGLEGISILGGAVLFCNTCIKANSSAAQPYVQIANVNTNAYENNISLSNFINLFVCNNLFYGAKKTPNPAANIALQINNADAALGINSGNIISGNSFYGLNNIGTTAKQGITINGSNGANTQTLVTGNVFVGYDFGVILYAGANNVIIDDTNVFAGCTTDISYQSTSGSASVFKRRPLGNGEQHIVAEQIVVSSADLGGSNVATAQSVFAAAQDTLTIAGSTTYEFEAEYEIDNTGTTSRTLSTLFALGGGASLTSIAYTALTTNAANASAPQAVSMTRAAVATAVAVTAAVAAATQNTVKLRGTMRVNAGGTITPQFQYSAAPGAAPTIKANSFFRLWPIGSNTVTTVGPWA